jgi:hypothetical protein
MYDECQVIAKAHMAFGQDELKMVQIFVKAGGNVNLLVQHNAEIVLKVNTHSM